MPQKFNGIKGYKQNDQLPTKSLGILKKGWITLGHLQDIYRKDGNLLSEEIS